MKNSFLIIITILIGLQIYSCTPKHAFTGTWKLSVPTPRGERNPILTVKGKKGTFDNEEISVAVRNDSIFFLAESQAGKIGVIKMNYTGVLKAGKMEGTYMVAEGPFKGRSSIFSAEKVEE